MAEPFILHPKLFIISLWVLIYMVIQIWKSKVLNEPDIVRFLIFEKHKFGFLGSQLILKYWKIFKYPKI